MRYSENAHAVDSISLIIYRQSWPKNDYTLLR